MGAAGASGRARPRGPDRPPSGGCDRGGAFAAAPSIRRGRSARLFVGESSSMAVTSLRPFTSSISSDTWGTASGMTVVRRNGAGTAPSVSKALFPGVPLTTKTSGTAGRFVPGWASESKVVRTNRFSARAKYFGWSLGDNCRANSTMNSVWKLVHSEPSINGSIPGKGEGIRVSARIIQGFSTSAAAGRRCLRRSRFGLRTW